MRYFVRATVFESIVRDEDVAIVRERFASQLKKIRESGKLTEGGIFADGRGGIFILDVSSAVEVFDLLGTAIVDHFNVETHPLITFDELMEFFSRDTATYAASI